MNDHRRAHAGIAAYNYAPRTAVHASALLMIAASLLQQAAPIGAWIVPILYCLGFPHLAWWLARRAADPRAVEERSVLLDHFVCGGFVALMRFDPLPSVACLVSLFSASMLIGGGRLLRLGLAAHALGAVAGAAAWGVRMPSGSASSLTVLSCLPILVLQPVMIVATARKWLTKLQAKREQLEFETRHDGLSGLYNRTHWESLVTLEFERCRRSGEPATLLLADLDHFKRLNDVHGHAAGDEAIRRFADIARRELRANDVAGRYGGEEFGLLLPRTPTAAAREVAERLREGLREEPPSGSAPVTASFGAVTLTADIDSVAAWIRLADQMLYRAKHLGRDRVETFGSAVPAEPPAAARGANGLRPAMRCSALSDEPELLSQMLSGLDLGAGPIALFDPGDRIAVANPAYLECYDVQPEARTFGDVMRDCHRRRAGRLIETDDFEAWLRTAQARRRSVPRRCFPVDFVDGTRRQAVETSFRGGWVLLTMFEPAPAPAVPVRRFAAAEEAAA